MKTKDLIRLLNEADPTGEEHCCIQNADVWDVMVEPAYYDGALHVIDRDEDNCPIRGRRVRSGKKITLSPISIADGIGYGEGFVVEYSNEEDRKRYEKSDLEAARGDREMEYKVGSSFFAEWVFLKIQAIKPTPIAWVDRIKAAAEKFYLENQGPDKDEKGIEERGELKNCFKSWNDRCHDLWEERISVDWDNYSRITIKFK